MSARERSGPILLVHFDRELACVLVEQLVADGFEVKLATTGEHALVLARGECPALLVLCSARSPRRALELVREIGSGAESSGRCACSVPSIVVGAGNGELELLRAFEAGADDYVPRAGSYLELRARVRALLRRSGPQVQRAQRLVVGSLAIDTLAHSARLDGLELALRPLEFALLVQLAREPSRVFTKSELLGSVWRYRAAGSTRTVDTHASRLRRKLCGAGGRGWVVSVWGVGYRLI